MKRVSLVILLVIILVITAGCTVSSMAIIPFPRITPIHTATPEAKSITAVQWMDLTCHLIEDESISPPQASRICAYTGVSLYESALPGMPGLRTLNGQLNAIPAMPKPESNQQYNWSISITAAMATTLKGLFTGASDQTLGAIQNLQDTQLKSEKENITNDIIQRSVAYGESIGKTILGWADQDGYLATRSLTYTPPTGSGMWVPTPPGYKPPLEPYWGNLRPFALYSADTCVPPAPVQYSTEPNSAFYQQALAVYKASKNLTDEQKTIANFWADNTGSSFTPPGHWLSIENQMVTQLNLSIDKAAELYALVGIAMGDAFISCWNTKFEYCVERPVTFINQQIDARWQPLLVTPPFPEYTSGHSVGSGAVSTVMSRILGKVSFVDKTYLDVGVPSRVFNSFETAAQEAAISRLYAGIHFPLSIQNGLHQGQMVGLNVLDRVQTRTR